MPKINERFMLKSSNANTTHAENRKTTTVTVLVDASGPIETVIDSVPYEKRINRINFVNPGSRVFSKQF